MATTQYNYVDEIGLEYVLIKIYRNIELMLNNYNPDAENVNFDNTTANLTLSKNTIQDAIEALKTLTDNKVDKDGNKVLSTYDFDNTYKDMLDGLATTLADYAALSGATFTGAITLPAVASGTNDNTAATTAFVASSISDAIQGITGISFDGPYADYATLVSTVTSPKNGVIYLVNNSGSAPNVNDEYFWDGAKFEKFGSTAADLTSCVKHAEMHAITTTEIDTILTRAGYTVSASV